MKSTTRPCPNCGGSAFRKKFAVDSFSVVKCRSCSLVFLQNPPGEAKLYEQYHTKTELEFEEYSAGSEDAQIAELFLINEQRITAVSRLKASGSLLDIGCGRGYFLKTSASHGFEVQGIDISETAVRYVRQKFDLQASCDTLDDLLQSNRKFDIISLWHVLEHFLDPFAVLDKVHQLLSEDGICVIEVPNLHSLKFMLAHQKWRGGNHPRFHRTFFSRQTLRTALQKSGFRNVKRVQLSYRLPGRNKGYEMLKSGLNFFALDAFLDFVAFK